MSRKERERERKLTSLILTGLMLSNGTFLTPVAEAGDTKVETAPYPNTLNMETLDGGYKLLFPKSWNVGDKLIFKYTGDEYSTYTLCGGFTNASGGNLSNRHVVVNAGSGRFCAAYGVYSATSGDVEN